MGAFSVFKDRKSKKNKETPSVESHYIRLAKITAFSKYFVLLLLILFAVYAFSFHSDVVTMDNFRYMLKFINLGEEAEATEGSIITFDTHENNKGLSFKGDMCIYNENTVTIMGWDGDVLAGGELGYDHPKAVENGKNVFCCDIGGNELSVYTSITNVLVQTYDYPISWIAASESGNYAVVSSTKGYRSAIFVYDIHFRNIYTLQISDKYVDFIDMTADGNYFYTLSHHSSGGNLVTQVSKYTVASTDTRPLFTDEYIGELPLGVYCTDYGYAVLTSGGIRTYDGENNLIGFVPSKGREILSCHIGSRYSVLAFGTEGLSGGNELNVYGSDGKLVSSREFSATPADYTVADDMLYTVSQGVLTVVDLTGNSDDVSYDVSTDITHLVTDDGRLILFSPYKAEIFSKNNYSEAEQ